MKFKKWNLRGPLRDSPKLQEFYDSLSLSRKHPWARLDNIRPFVPRNRRARQDLESTVYDLVYSIVTKRNGSAR